MKMKLPALSGKVIVIKSDQEEARKCYENSLKTKRSVVMMIERPPVPDSQMELEPLEEETPTESTPIVITLGATPIGDAHTEERNNNASPVGGIHGEASATEREPEEAVPDASGGATSMEEDSMNENLAENVQNGQPQTRRQHSRKEDKG